MPRVNPLPYRGTLFLCLLLLLPACATRRTQLEQVAKDWCETIRASQVLPIYPLTADLQPGDIFLVQQTVSRQHEAYEEAGFLPLPFKIARIDPTGYADHYDTVSGDLAVPTLPRTIGADRPDFAVASLHRAPTAAFPSYSFQIQNGASFDLAVPVSGVPVGMSAMGTSGASVTVTIKDAKTYGVDAFSIDRDVRLWASGSDVQGFLKGLVESSPDEPVYLRVVSRVYLAHEFDIAMNRRDSRSFGLTGGLPGSSSGASGGGAAGLVSPDPNARPGEATAADYRANLQALNESIAGSLDALNGGAGVGGDLRFVAASASTVSLRETFAEPLVVGYLGFDMRVRADGTLGPPIPTFQVLEEEQVPRDVRFSGGFTRAEQAYIPVFDQVDARPDAQVIFGRAASFLGREMKDLYDQALPRVLEADDPVREAWNVVFDAQLQGETDRSVREARYESMRLALRQALNEARNAE